MSKEVIQKKIHDFLFIKDILEVYEEHGLSISHEDPHGAFLVEEISSENIEWLKNAISVYQNQKLFEKLIPEQERLEEELEELEELKDRLLEEKRLELERKCDERFKKGWLVSYGWLHVHEMIKLRDKEYIIRHVCESIVAGTSLTKIGILNSKTLETIREFWVTDYIRNAFEELRVKFEESENEKV